MESQPELQFSDFQKALTKKRIFTFQMNAITLLVGVTLFLGIILLLYYYNSPQETLQQTSESGILPIFSMVHAFMACCFYGVTFFVYQYLVGWKGIEMMQKSPLVGAMQEETTLETLAYSLIFKGFIIRAAIMDGIAMFGLITCLMGVQNGEIYNEPIYWLNLFSYVFFVVVILWTFPTKDRLETIFRKRFLNEIVFFATESRF